MLLYFLWRYTARIFFLFIPQNVVVRGASLRAYLSTTLFDNSSVFQPEPNVQMDPRESLCVRQLLRTILVLIADGLFQVFQSRP